MPRDVVLDIATDGTPAVTVDGANPMAVYGDGFVPGEDVAVAVILAHTDAAPDGTARSLVAPNQAATSLTCDVVLVGRVSGTLTIGHPAL